ncbi:MAG: hypothetical protein JWN14_1508 [Chthonomonadales bacterium]|nr:hypothetical protein [Chthonomonadales bacterium]
MSANSQEIIQQVRQEFEAVITNMIQANPQPTTTADAIERELWKFMLPLGRGLMAAFLVRRAEEVAPSHVRLSETQVLPLQDNLPRSYHCVFGKICFTRRYYYRPGQGAFPADADLNLPKNACSDLLREWQERLGTAIPYTEANQILENWLGHPFSNRALQEALMEDAEQVLAFYEQADLPLSDPEATLLVVQADGKGVPLVKDSPPNASVRAGKGAKPGKKEAIVTSVYTLAPAPRTPESVVASLFHDQKQTPPRGGPHGKWLWATLAGKSAALEVTAEQVRRREGSHVAARVALTDGAEALQARVLSQFPDFTLVLDFIHADEYLWKAANALLGEAAPERAAWVEARTLQMLQGQIAAVVADLRAIAARPDISKTVRQTLLGVAGYYERNQAYMQYYRYLAAGWPIASGVIEGACRHLVKDRCELSGMRWTQAGAEALLRLRSVLENGDWESFHSYRRQRQRGVYGYWKAEQAETSPMPLRFAA